MVQHGYRLTGYPATGAYMHSRFPDIPSHPHKIAGIYGYASINPAIFLVAGGTATNSYHTLFVSHHGYERETPV
jgi:hypothetical protein